MLLIYHQKICHSCNYRTTKFHKIPIKTCGFLQPATPTHLPPTKPDTTETMRPLNNCRSGKTLRISAVPTTSSLGRCKETWMTFWWQGFWPFLDFWRLKFLGDFLCFSGVNVYLPFLMWLNDILNLLESLRAVSISPPTQETKSMVTAWWGQ